jgi:hypothetical protein
MYKGWGPGMQGTQSESNWSDMRSYEGGGNVVQYYSVWEMKGLSNIIKNHLGEVKMALEESDMTNGTKWRTVYQKRLLNMIISPRAGHHTCIWVQPYRLQLSTVQSAGFDSMGMGLCYICTVHLLYIYTQEPSLATVCLIPAGYNGNGYK